MDNWKKLHSLFLEAVSELDQEKLNEFLSYSYGAMSNFIPDYMVESIENELKSQLKRS